ncbi:MAG: hypothetical protein ABJH05_00935 [Fulvivirga sp.]
MRTLKSTLLSLILLSTAVIGGCGPKKGTIEDKEAVKNDTLDVNEGVGEGPVGESEHK